MMKQSSAVVVKQVDSKQLESLSCLLIEQLNPARPTLDEIKQILFKLKNAHETSGKLNFFGIIFGYAEHMDLQRWANEIKEEFNYNPLNFHRSSFNYTSTKSWQTLQDAGNIKLIKTDGNTSMIIHQSDNGQQLLIKDELNNQLMHEIDKLESQCIDIRLVDTDTYSIREPSIKLNKNGNMSMNNDITGTFDQSERGNYILNILDPLLNMKSQNGYMI